MQIENLYIIKEFSKQWPGIVNEEALKALELKASAEKEVEKEVDKLNETIIKNVDKEQELAIKIDKMAETKKDQLLEELVKEGLIK